METFILFHIYFISLQMCGQSNAQDLGLCSLRLLTNAPNRQKEDSQPTCSVRVPVRTSPRHTPICAPGHANSRIAHVTSQPQTTDTAPVRCCVLAEYITPWCRICAPAQSLSLYLTFIACTIGHIMKPSTKPEVHNVQKRHQRTTEPQPQVTCTLLFRLLGRLGPRWVVVQIVTIRQACIH